MPPETPNIIFCHAHSLLTTKNTKPQHLKNKQKRNQHLKLKSEVPTFKKGTPFKILNKPYFDPDLRHTHNPANATLCWRGNAGQYPVLSGFIGNTPLAVSLAVTERGAHFYVATDPTSARVG